MCCVVAVIVLCLLWWIAPNKTCVFCLFDVVLCNLFVVEVVVLCIVVAVISAYCGG